MCLWDESCIPRMKEELEQNILAFIRTVQDVSICLYLNQTLNQLYFSSEN